jgi:hypothetical protein
LGGSAVAAGDDGSSVRQFASVVAEFKPQVEWRLANYLALCEDEGAPCPVGEDSYWILAFDEIGGGTQALRKIRSAFRELGKPPSEIRRLVRRTRRVIDVVDAEYRRAQRCIRAGPVPAVYESGSNTCIPEMGTTGDALAEASDQIRLWEPHLP